MTRTSFLHDYSLSRKRTDMFTHFLPPSPPVMASGAKPSHAVEKPSAPWREARHVPSAEAYSAVVATATKAGSAVPPFPSAVSVPSSPVPRPSSLIPMQNDTRVVFGLSRGASASCVLPSAFCLLSSPPRPSPRVPIKSFFQNKPIRPLADFAQFAQWSHHMPAKPKIARPPPGSVYSLFTPFYPLAGQFFCSLAQDLCSVGGFLHQVTRPADRNGNDGDGRGRYRWRGRFSLREKSRSHPFTSSSYVLRITDYAYALRIAHPKPCPARPRQGLWRVSKMARFAPEHGASRATSRHTPVAPKLTAHLFDTPSPFPYHHILLMRMENRTVIGVSHGAPRATPKPPKMAVVAVPEP
jgi:hypothetical protein